MKTPIMGYGIVVCALATLLPAADAHAAFGSREIGCRETISKAGAKLAKKALQTLSSCHQRRLSGRLPSSIDCNDLDAADPRRKLAAAAESLRLQASDRCKFLAPPALGYRACPSPCTIRVPSIATFDDVAACTTCITKDSVELLVGTALGLPASPLGDTENQCHGAIGIGQRKHFRTILNERRKCQKAAEAAGATEVTSCSGADPRGKISRAADQSAASIVRACDAPGIDLFAVDSCNQSVASRIVSCVSSAAEYLGNEVFRSFYFLDIASVTTTTTTTLDTGSSTTTVSSTTTTTLDQTSDYACTLTFRVTSSELLGSLKYEVDYGTANGGFLGSALGVQCTNLVAGVSKSFFDDEANRKLRESVIAVNGFQGPLSVATCSYETDDSGLAAGDFTLTVRDATTPDFQIVTPTMTISSVSCAPK